MSKFAMRIEEMLMIHHRVMPQMVDHRKKVLTRENAAMALGWSVDKLQDFETQNSVATYTILDMYRYIALIERRVVVLSDEQYEHLLKGPVE